MLTLVLNIIDKVLEKNKNVAYFTSIVLLVFVCIQIHDIKQQVVSHSSFIAELRKANVIKQAESIKHNVEFLANIELRLALEYCDEKEISASISKSCDIIYEYLSSPQKNKL